MSAVRFSIAALALAACGGAALAAQSAVIDRSYRVASFDKVASAGPNLVVVHVGGPVSVTARGPADMLEKMEVVVERGALQIRPRREFRQHFDWRGIKPATFTVSMPRVSAASLVGSGDMKVDRAEGGRFDGSVAGSGNLDIAALRVANASLSTAGSGNLSARGDANTAELSVTGSGSIRARHLTSRTGAVSIAGSGDAELTARNTVDVSIVGSGEARIAGGAHCRVTRVGSGQARCG
jgi:hypothetical protein